MARKLRIEFAGACYHVINRGNYRRPLFAGHDAADAFQRCLFEACPAFGWVLHAFVVMSNHFHLAVETPEPNLSEGMKWLQGTWTSRFNRFRGEIGRPFQGRYKALHVQPGHALAQFAHYIHLNPVRAGLVTTENLLDYRWSSLPFFVRGPRPAFLVAANVLGESGGLPDTTAGWKSYVGYLRLIAESDPKLRGEKFAQLTVAWAIGSDDFIAELRQKLAARAMIVPRFQLLGADRNAQRDARAAVWEDRLRNLATAFGIALDRLPQQRSAPEKLRLAAALKMTSSVSNRWLAQRLQMGNTSSIGALVRRFHLRGETRNEHFLEVLSRFTT